jgi:hypothetical protein
MNVWIADRSRKQFRCGSRRVGKDGAAQVVLENQDLARDFAEFADVMSVLLNSRRAAGDSGPAVGDVRFPSNATLFRAHRGLPS